MATIKDVAKLANVSVATVSRVINNSSKVSPGARAAVVHAQDELNYHPSISARSIAKQDAETVGLTIADPGDPYFGTMARTVENEARKMHLPTLINSGYHDAMREQKAIDELLRHRCRCLVVHALLMEDNVLSNYMRNNEYMILINRKLTGFENRCIYLDDETGAYIAVKHLIANGHRNIAYIKSSHPIDDTTNRLLGYKKALEEAGIPYNPALVVEEEPNAQGGEEGAQTLLNSSQTFTAIACYNDMQAAGAMAILIDNDVKIPENISIIGYDNMFISRYLQPRLTTVLNPVTTMASTAIQLSVALSRGEDTSGFTRKFTPTLIKRFSVKDLNNF